MNPTTDHEEAFWAQDLLVAGIDEVGRGAWAGPLCVGAVILNPAGPQPVGVRDSKQLSARQRAIACTSIAEHVLASGLGWVEAQELDRIGLSAALSLASVRALADLGVTPGALIIDGPVNLVTNHVIDGAFALMLKSLPTLALARADASVLTVAAASVIAKEARDAHMRELESDHPSYGWSSNKGYMTRAHRDAVSLQGLCVQHRRSWSVPC